jgi:hypothetical protein
MMYRMFDSDASIPVGRAANDLRPASKGRVWAPVAAVAARLFTQSAESHEGGQVFIVHLDDGLLGTLPSHTSRQGSLDAVAARLSQDVEGPATLVIGIDALGGLQDAVEALLAFRADWPEVGIVIASHHFKRDDFSPERRAIADASLRLPATQSRLGLAIAAAARHKQTKPIPH